MNHVSYTTIQNHTHRASIIPSWNVYVGKGKEELVRAMICGCGERLLAADDERLV
jgi:hypothetical protein